MSDQYTGNDLQGDLLKAFLQWVDDQAAALSGSLPEALIQEPRPMPRPVPPYGTLKIAPTKKEHSTGGNYIAYHDLTVMIYDVNKERAGTVAGLLQATMAATPLVFDGLMRIEDVQPKLETLPERVNGDNVHRATAAWSIWVHGQQGA